ncbi:carbohydrate ABC transporter permease [Prescottella equi]|uniref:carbohydrate ABC transporter permease n=1 Tax=Rhodococcus hoagii TaxID=43767 RepID=UPI0011AAAA6E|nr:sugar ABC transporter permease [Prescottella equi]
MFVEVPTISQPQPATSPPHQRAGAGWRASAARRAVPYLFLLPATVLLVLWTYKPLAETVGLSFYKWNMIPTSPKEPVGLDNYTAVLSLPELHQALWNTVAYIAAFIVFSLVLPLVIALLCTRVSGRARTFYQALIFVPFLVTPVASSAIWRWLFNPDNGMIPRISAAMGHDLGNVFRDPKLALIGVVVIVGWQMLGFGVLVISAGMAGISPDYGHAAALDGATPSTITRRITLPLLSPTLVFLALMTILLSAQWTYPVIDVLTQGGPSGSSTNIYYLLYEFGFRNFDAGLSAAAGTLFFLGFGLVAFVFVRLSERLTFYDN